MKNRPALLLFLLPFLFVSCDMKEEGEQIAVSTLRINEFVYEGFVDAPLYLTIVRHPEELEAHTGGDLRIDETGSFPVEIADFVWKYEDRDEDDGKTVWLAGTADVNKNGKADATDMFMPMLRFELTPDGVTTLEKVDFNYGLMGAYGWFDYEDGPDPTHPRTILFTSLVPEPVNAEHPLGFRFSETINISTTMNTAPDICFRVYDPQISAVYVRVPYQNDWSMNCYGLAFYDADNSITTYGVDFGEYTSSSQANSGQMEWMGEDHYDWEIKLDWPR